jgi:hypothetical protein
MYSGSWLRAGRISARANRRRVGNFGTNVQALDQREHRGAERKPPRHGYPLPEERWANRGASVSGAYPFVPRYGGHPMMVLGLPIQRDTVF